jgi:hypothetical protein
MHWKQVPCCRSCLHIIVHSEGLLVHYGMGACDSSERRRRQGKGCSFGFYAFRLRFLFRGGGEGVSVSFSRALPTLPISTHRVSRYTAYLHTLRFHRFQFGFPLFGLIPLFVFLHRFHCFLCLRCFHCSCRKLHFAFRPDTTASFYLRNVI